MDALIRTAHQLPNELYKSLTWDRGKEMADHRRFTLATDIQVISATRRALGSAGRTRTLTAFCGSTFRRASTCPAFPKASWMKLQEA